MQVSASHTLYFTLLMFSNNKRLNKCLPFLQGVSKYTVVNLHRGNEQNDGIIPTTVSQVKSVYV